jgi:signal transduction histidine kinase
MNTLYAKLGLLLAGAFVVVGGALVMATQTMFDRDRLIELSSYVMIASVAFALLAALCVFQLFTRRLKRLADAVETIARGGFTAPLRVPGADPRGDEIDRLSTYIERMSERIAEQLAQLERGVGRRRELLANVSHDLRTPLASIQGYLELLLLHHGSLAATDSRHYLETAVRQSERLGRLVGDLFELTKLEAEDAQPRPEAFSLAELAQDVVQKFMLNAQLRQIELRACGGDGGPAMRVHADIAMVERVLENLLDNALRHTPAGGAVSVELDHSAQRARMTVRDTGPGIAADDLTGIFERYDRADRSLPADHSGLGLAIARRIVQLHGGALTVRSAVGSGTCFTFDLPLAESVTAPARSDERAC